MSRSFRIFVGCFIAVLSSQALAWTAVAYSKDSGYSHINYDAANPEEAKRTALAGCSKKAKECVIVGGANVGPGALVVAKGAGGMSMSFRKSPEEAEKNALSNCKEKYSKCRVVDAAWDEGANYFALAMGDKYYYFVYGADSDLEAKQGAIAGCEKGGSSVGSCKIAETFSGSGPTWFVSAFSGDDGWIGLNRTKVDAVEAAMSGCRKKVGQGNKCKVQDEFHNPPSTDAPASFKRLEARIAAATQAVSKPSSPSVSNDCRPKSDYLRCTSQCTNGNCIVTYENGCKMQVQVRPKHNPFNNQWEYPSPSC